MHQFKVGDRVRFKDTGDACHAVMPEFYPEDGTIGTIIYSDSEDQEVCVQWPEGSTSEKDKWWAFVVYLELVEE